MNNISGKLSLILITLWVGALWTVGFIVAPTLFHALSDNKALAGNLAGELFKWVAYIGIFSGFYLAIYRVSSAGTNALKTSVFWVILAMLAITLLSHFGISPILASLKAEALLNGASDVMQSVFASRFKTWHGVSSIAYLIQSLLGVLLVLKARD